MHSSPLANQNALLAYENPPHLTTAYTVTTTTTTHTQTQAAYTLPYDLSSTGNAELWGTETLSCSGSSAVRQPDEMIVDAVRIPEEFGVEGENDGLLSCGLLPEAVPNILLDLEFPCPFRYLTANDMGPEQKPWTRLSWAELHQHPTQGPQKQVIERTRGCVCIPRTNTHSNQGLTHPFQIEYTNYDPRGRKDSRNIHTCYLCVSCTCG